MAPIEMGRIKDGLSAAFLIGAEKLATALLGRSIAAT
jgi:hypothetical protein